MRQRISLTQYFTEHTGVSVRQFLNEAKFRGLTDEELLICNDELAAFKKNDELVKYFHTKINKYPEYGHKFYVLMKNPFNDPYKFSKTYTGDANDQEVVETEKEIECIGIADKFGRIFLQNVWEKDEPAYIEYKKAETKTSKNGYKYKTKEGWYLTRKNIDVYNVREWNSGKRGESPFHFTDEKISHGVWAKFIGNDVKYVIDLSTAPVEVERITKKIEADKEAEAKRKQAEEENKKFWDERKDYKNCGCANAWGDKTPEEVAKAWADKDAKWFEVSIGRCYTQHWCDTYKLYYSVDSSD